jgi:large subunit ribosomal protein L15
MLAALRVVRHADKPIKVLGEGEITRAFQVKATKFSGSARAKIEAAGGSVLEG